MKASIQNVALLATLFLESASASCGHGTSMMKRHVHMKRDLNGGLQKRVEVATFGYLGETGPTNWDKLAPENAACRTSKVQSPIDINPETSTLVEAGKLKMDFPHLEGAEFENLGSTIEVIMEGKNATTTVDGKVFNLAQFHFHTPGEHAINGEYMPLEMHMVHEAEDGALAVIAVPFQLCEAGGSNPLLNALLPSMEAIREPGKVTETGPIDFSGLIAALEVQPLRTYSGSLTTPPCAEGLTFFVATQTLPLDVKTYNLMKSIIGFNSRFVQNAVGADNLLAL